MEVHPDCLMPGTTVKLISDAGYQGEITGVVAACQQLEVFSRVRSSLATILDGGEAHLAENLPQFSKMVCHGSTSHLLAQVLDGRASRKASGVGQCAGGRTGGPALAQESGHDARVDPLALGRAASYPRLCQALGAMLSKGP